MVQRHLLNYLFLGLFKAPCRTILVNMEHTMIAEFNEHGLKLEEGKFYGDAELQGESQGQ